VLAVGALAVAGAAVGVAVAAGCCRSKPAARPTVPAAAPPPSPAAAGPASAAGADTAAATGSGSISVSVSVSGSGSGSGSVADARDCERAPLTWRFPAQPRVIALGDVHGDLAATRRALRLGGVLDDADHWQGGATWVVQTGDILDRGDDEQAIIDLFERLEGEAQAAGGRFVWLLGNHELMNPAFDLRYVTRGGFRDFEDVPGLALDGFADAPAGARARLAAFAPGGPYARVLAGQPVVAIVGDTAFVHGGIVPGVAATLDGEQRATRCWLEGAGPPPAILDRQDGPVWDRSLGGDAIDCGRLATALAELGAKRMVVGHTVQPRITSACGDTIYRIDVGLAAYYGGPTEVLELTPAGARILGR
jgi:hypothetical protein